MPTKIRPANAIRHSNISEMLKRKFIRANTPYRITPERECYVVDGKEISVQDFNKMYPEISLIPVATKGGNSDRTKNWMFDKKSF